MRSIHTRWAPYRQLFLILNFFCECLECRHLISERILWSSLLHFSEILMHILISCTSFGGCVDIAFLGFFLRLEGSHLYIHMFLLRIIKCHIRYWYLRDAMLTAELGVRYRLLDTIYPFWSIHVILRFIRLSFIFLALNFLHLRCLHAHREVLHWALLSTHCASPLLLYCSCYLLLHLHVVVHWLRSHQCFILCIPNSIISLMFARWHSSGKWSRHWRSFYRIVPRLLSWKCRFYYFQIEELLEFWLRAHDWDPTDNFKVVGNQLY